MLRKAAAFLGVAVVSLVLFTPICGALHRCGCQAPWSGGKTYCNIKQATGPHCPWCEHPALGGVSAALMLGGQLWFRLALGRLALAGPQAPPSSRFLRAVVAGGSPGPTDYPHPRPRRPRSSGPARRADPLLRRTAARPLNYGRLRFCGSACRSSTRIERFSPAFRLTAVVACANPSACTCTS